MSEMAQPAVLDTDDARRLTERIRYTTLGVCDGMEKLQLPPDPDAHVHVLALTAALDGTAAGGLGRALRITTATAVSA